MQFVKFDAMVLNNKYNINYSKIFYRILFFFLSVNTIATTFAQVGIPVDKSTSSILSDQGTSLSSLLDTLSVLNSETNFQRLLFKVSQNLDLSNVLPEATLFDEKVDSVIDWETILFVLDSLMDEKVDSGLKLEEDYLNQIREEFSDPLFLDGIFNIGYKKFIAKFDIESKSDVEIKRDFERALQVLFQNKIYLNKIIKEEISSKNSLNFEDDENVSLIFEKEKLKDEHFNKKIETLNSRVDLGIYYYNRTRSNQLFYFPIFDWRKDMNKAKLTELFFTNQFSKEKLSALSSSLLNINFNNSASLYTELLSSFIGPGKIALTTQVSSSPETSDTTAFEKDAAIQRLIGGGGNLGLAYQIPILSAHVAKNIQWGSILQPRMGFDVPELSSTLDTATVQWELANQGFLNIYTSSDALSFLVGYKIALVGGNMNYKSIIGQNTFNYNQISLGITINETFRIVYNDFFGSEFIKENFPSSTISLILIPR